MNLPSVSQWHQGWCLDRRGQCDGRHAAPAAIPVWHCDRVLMGTAATRAGVRRIAPLPPSLQPLRHPWLRRMQLGTSNPAQAVVLAVSNAGQHGAERNASAASLRSIPGAACWASEPAVSPGPGLTLRQGPAPCRRAAMSQSPRQLHVLVHGDPEERRSLPNRHGAARSGLRRTPRSPLLHVSKRCPGPLRR